MNEPSQVLISVLVMFFFLNFCYLYLFLFGRCCSVFEMVALCCEKYCNAIPVVLMLGFFTGTVMQRWWAVYNAIPGTAKIITLATLHLKKDKADVLNIVKLVMIEKLKSLICFLFFFFLYYSRRAGG